MPSLTLLTTVVLAPLFCLAPEDAAGASAPALLAETETLRQDRFTIVVPKEWRDQVFVRSSTMKLYLSGDGKGIPLTDENGAPLQAGISVERFESQETLEDGVAELIRAAKRSPRVRVTAEPIVEDVKLSAQVPAKLVTTQFAKPPARRSLQLKLCLKDSESNSWVVSAWIVAGEESTLPTPESRLAQRLRVLLKTFALRSSDPAE